MRIIMVHFQLLESGMCLSSDTYSVRHVSDSELDIFRTTISNGNIRIDLSSVSLICMIYGGM